MTTPESLHDAAMETLPESQRPSAQFSEAEIERRFTYHRPEGQKIVDHDDIRAHFKLFATFLAVTLPDGREKAVAFTKLEEAANWAHAAVARDGK